MTSATTPSEHHRDDLAWNGVDGASGDPLFPPLDLRELGRAIRNGSAENAQLRQMRTFYHQSRQRSLGPKEGVDPRRLEETGWAVIFAEDADPRLREALEPLLVHRHRQAGRVQDGRYRELAGRYGYRHGESKLRFVARHGMGPGPADPDRLPYYLLLVGGPEEIPYSFQYELDVQYAVGRVAFDTPEEYARYAEAVVAAETGAFPRPRQAAFFGVRQEGDRATEVAHELLTAPLASQLARESPSWDVVTSFGPEATRERLGELLGQSDAPALLFTSSHGLGFREPHEEQEEKQGGLVCQRSDGSPYFTAADLDDEASPGGLITFAFACYSAGTPQRNNYAHRGVHERAEISDRPFVARLPQRLLSHPRGGALAVVGHVDRAWSFSFMWPGADRQVEVFASALKRLLAGHPLGSAMEYFNQRYAELECGLAGLRREIERGEEPDLLELADLWTARNDARNFVVLGDPAVRLSPFLDDGMSRG